VWLKRVVGIAGDDQIGQLLGDETSQAAEALDLGDLVSNTLLGGFGSAPRSCRRGPIKDRRVSLRRIGVLPGSFISHVVTFAKPWSKCRR
jgi:hypothetical protein